MDSPASSIRLTLRAGLVVAGLVAGASSSARADTFELDQRAKLALPSPSGDEALGTAVAAAGDTLVVGAPGDDGGAGSVHVYVRSAGVWSAQAEVGGSGSTAGDGFANVVAVDGDTLVVGAPLDDTPAGVDAGSVYVYVRSGTSWSLEQQLLASDAAGGDEFATAVSISGDTIVVGAPFDDTLDGADAGSAYVFVRSGTVWSEQQKLLAPNAAAGDGLGSAVAVDGETTIVGAPSHVIFGSTTGSVYAYTRSGTAWSLEQEIFRPGSMLLGRALDLEGDRAFIAQDRAPQNDTFYTFARSGTTWAEEYLLYDISQTAQLEGASIALEGDLAVVGSALQDTVYVWRIDGAPTPWASGNLYHTPAVLTGDDTLTGDGFGSGVAVAGGEVLIGSSSHDTTALNAGAVYTAELIDSIPCSTQEQRIDDELIRASLTISGDTAVFGPSQPFGLSGDPALVYVRGATSWTEEAQLLPADTPVEGFGQAVALDGDVLVAGAPRDSVPGTNSGAVYAFTRTGTAWSEEAKLEPADVAPFDSFGFDVDVDGDTLVAGSLRDDDNGSNSGSAYVFVRSGTTWTEEAKLLASDGTSEDFFGTTVAVSGDLAAVGATSASTAGNETGAVYVYRRSGTLWTEEARLVGSGMGDGDLFGTHLSISGDRIAASGTGATYVFARSGTTWSEEALIDGAPNNQPTVALDGSSLLVGDEDIFGLGGARLYQRVGSSWTLQRYLVADDPANDQVDRFGHAVALDGGRAVVTSWFSRAYFFAFPNDAPSFCDATDGALASCPCANPGHPDTGCDIQQGTGGVRLDLTAQETLPLNRVTMNASGFPPGSAPAAVVVRSGTLDAGSPVVFGDGLRCVGTPLVRLGASMASGGASVHTFGHGAMAGTGDFYYQLWFRNTPAMYCDPAAAFNLSNGRVLSW